ncbi:MAG: methyltransferase [Parachlamydiaceae bacterium]|nr:MAG: methyltransferase [Parachlamydiaceae bacterium]
MPLFFIFVLAGLILIIGWSLKNGIGPMPTASKTKMLLFKHLPKEKEGVIYELGSGWGTLAFPLARRYPSSTIIAYENSPIPYLFSKMGLFASGLHNLIFLRHNFLCRFKKCDDGGLLFISESDGKA